MSLQCPLITKVHDILKIYHDSDHTGINAALTNIRREFYWSGMANEVEIYVSLYFGN